MNKDKRIYRQLNMEKKSHIGRKIAIVLLIIVLILVGASYIYLSDYYRASDYVTSRVRENSMRIDNDGNMTTISPENPLSESIGVIFYPGGKVEASAYMPLLLKLSDIGVTSVLMEMPGNLAVLNIDAADEVFDKFPEIKTWYIAGHSLGGAMASQYMEKNSDKVKGLILLGAYPVNDAAVDSLVIYGTYDVKLDLEKVVLADEVFEIIGGNHAYFGDYGEQEGDGTSLITREEQQSQAVERIQEFILKNN